MKRILFLGIVLMAVAVSLNACGEPSKGNLDHQLKETGTLISQESYQHASEKIRVVEDWWNFQRKNYKGKDKRKMDKLILKVENSLAIANKKKSKQAWQRLKHQWSKMNQICDSR